MTSAIATERWPLVGRRTELERFNLALTDRGCEGVVLHGDAGVGKTRLADECRRAAELTATPVARAVASATAATIPLGAIAHLLPLASDATAPLDPVRLFHDAREALARDDGQRLVLVVDDLHLLDATSAMLVAQLMAAGVVFLLGTVRRGEPIADAISNLWRDERVLRIDLEPLSRTSVDTLLHRALGGPLDAAALETLWAASRGNALVLRELATGAIANDGLVEIDGVWRLDGELPRTNQLVELVQARIATVDEDERAVLELLAWCAPVGRDDLPANAALETLERRGLVALATDGRRTTVSLAHPLYGEVLRALQPRVAAARTLITHARRVEAHGMRRREDELRVATWQLDAGADVDPRQLEDAARLARHAHDYRQVERLAAAAWTARRTVDTGLLLGEARYELGSFAAAEETLAATAPLAASDEEVLRVAVARDTNLFWGLLRFDDALAVNRDAQVHVTDEDVRRQLGVDEAAILMFSGRPAAASERLDGLGPLPEGRPLVEWAIVAAPTLAVRGETRRAIDIAHNGFARHSELGDLIAIAHPGTHVVNEVFALTEAGALDEATELGTAGYEVSVAQAIPITQIWFSINLGRIALVRGLPATAERWLRVGLALARATGFEGPREMALRGLAMARAQLGDAAGARAIVAEIDALPARLGFMEPETDLGRAWALAAGGETAAARTLLLDGAAAALATGHRTSAAWLLHDAARLGDATDACDRIGGAAGTSDSPLVEARIAHVTALAHNDAAELVAAVEQLERVGLVLAAAEAATAAAEALRGEGETRAAAAMTARAAALAGMCEGARTPGLVAADTVVPLSRREREIALLAADGVPSKEIAARLFVSVRTVNNHLQNAYTKLGVSGRNELRAALRLAGEGEPT